MNIDIILEFFYCRASNRIKEKVTESNLTHREIYLRDSKQISWIINNNRTKNNRFLITDAVLENCDDFGEPDGLLKKLPFRNIKEILWGTDYEIECYLPLLFELLWDEVSYEDNPNLIDKELYLCDYIPYAKYSTYWNIIFSENNIYPAISYGIMEDDVINNIDKAREQAYIFLYNKYKIKFKKIFVEFVEKTDSFHKINQVFLDNFIRDKFIPMLIQNKPNSISLGLRVKNLIEADLSHVASLSLNDDDIEQKYYSKLINASSTYIVLLEKIQSAYLEQLKRETP
ncbi:hypothetical protein JCM1393_10270 [Clostridium carnis]